MNVKKWLCLALTVVLVLGFAACGGGAGSSVPPREADASQPEAAPSGDENPNASRERVTIRVAEYGVIMDNAEPENDRIKKVIEDKLNIDLEYVSYESAVWDESIENALAAGTGFDIFHNWAQPENTTRWVNEGAVVAIGDMVTADPERYPVLSKLFNSANYKMFSSSITGKDAIYGLLALSQSAPNSASSTRWYAGTLTYNKMILNAAGFTEAPKNLAEFIEYGEKAAAAGYTAWWPRNNKLTSLEEIDKVVAYPMGTSIRANVEGVTQGMMPDGEDKWKSVTVSDESREALRVLNQMYNNGTLPKGIGTEEDFATMLDWWDNNQTGAISYFVSSGAQYAWTLNDRYKKVNEDATYEDIIVGPMIQAEDGSYPIQYDVPFWLGAYTMIASSCEYPDRALDYLEFLGTTEGQDLIFKGIEGTHYTMDGGKVVFNTEEWKNENVMWGFEDGRCYYPWGSFFYNTQSNWTPWEASLSDWYDMYNESYDYRLDWTGSMPPEEAYGKEITDQNRANVFMDLPTYYALVTFPEDVLAMREQLRAIVEEYVPAFITGQKSLDNDWDEYVQKYTDAGMAQVEAAVNQGIADAKALYEAAAA